MLMVLCCNDRRDGTLGLTLDPQLIRDLTVLITSSTVRILMPYHTLLVLSACQPVQFCCVHAEHMGMAQAHSPSP